MNLVFMTGQEATKKLKMVFTDGNEYEVTIFMAPNATFHTVVGRTWEDVEYLGMQHFTDGPFDQIPIVPIMQADGVIDVERNYWEQKLRDLALRAKTSD